MAREIHWTDFEEIGIQLQEKFPEIDPLTVRFTDLHRYVIELEGFADEVSQSNEARLEAIQMAWHESSRMRRVSPDSQASSRRTPDALSTRMHLRSAQILVPCWVQGRR